MRTKLAAIKCFDEIEEDKDTASLLREVNGILYKFYWHKNPYLALDDAKSKFFSYYQKESDIHALHFNILKVLVGGRSPWR